MGNDVWSGGKAAFPCKDCTERHRACSADCEKYKEAKKKYDEKMKHLHDEKEMDHVMRSILARTNRGGR